MTKKFIKLSSNEMSVAELNALLNSHKQLKALDELAESCRRNKIEFGDNSTYRDRFLSEVKKILT
jgi:hypothetical protein